MVDLKGGAFPAGLERLQSSVNNPELKASEVMDGLWAGFNLRTSSDMKPELTIFQWKDGLGRSPGSSSEDVEEEENSEVDEEEVETFPSSI